MTRIVAGPCALLQPLEATSLVMATTVEATVKRIVTADVVAKIMRRVVMVAGVFVLVVREEGRWGRVTAVKDVVHGPRRICICARTLGQVQRANRGV